MWVFRLFQRKVHVTNSYRYLILSGYQKRDSYPDSEYGSDKNSEPIAELVSSGDSSESFSLSELSERYNMVTDSNIVEDHSKDS
ncbi:hypothetical protein NPIL_399101 [Nephila pilipes]|uniref:Uncharacterized protein n=1 Tax=Nephila pilipes TaxID=299642 RepID=A0A8X6QYD3_NEPPI|nr:hypothetical protein NPIL_399101 [Nephila pilipes]